MAGTVAADTGAAAAGPALHGVHAASGSKGRQSETLTASPFVPSIIAVPGMVAGEVGMSCQAAVWHTAGNF